MEPKKQGAVLVIVGLCAFAGLIAIVYYLAKLLLTFLATAQSQLSVAIVAGSIAASASLISLFVTKHLDRKATIQQENRSKKIPVYEELLGLFFEVFYATKSAKAEDQHSFSPELLTKFTNMSQKLIIWGSDDVIKAFANFRTGAVEKNDSMALVNSLGSVFLAIRRDLGHKDVKLSHQDLLKLFINDLPK
jgi:hypothetical protein